MAVSALLVLAGALAVAQSNPHAGDPKAAESGRGVFRIHCSPCHGIAGKGGRGPDLTRGVHAAGDADADLFRVISEGVPGTEMVDFSKLEADAVWRLVTFIRSIGAPAATGPAGDAASGETLFWGRARCGQCHQVGGRGGRLGPELTRAGRSRSLAYLRESIVAPNADLSPGYATVRVTTREGREIVGVERGFDNFSVQLLDAAENLMSFFRSEIREARREQRSLMPEDYGRRLEPREIDDLTAYLAGLGRTKGGR
jgi:putative heme-binding domain-containing protein